MRTNIDIFLPILHDIFTPKDLTILQCFLIEIISAVIFSLSRKHIAKALTIYSSKNKLISFDEYSPNTFSKSAIAYLFILLEPDTVIIKQPTENLILEEFYNLLGEKTAVKYENNERGEFKSSFFDLPIFAFLIYLPLIVGVLLFLARNTSQSIT